MMLWCQAVCVCSSRGLQKERNTAQLLSIKQARKHKISTNLHKIKGNKKIRAQQLHSEGCERESDGDSNREEEGSDEGGSVCVSTCITNLMGSSQE